MCSFHSAENTTPDAYYNKYGGAGMPYIYGQFNHGGEEKIAFRTYGKVKDQFDEYRYLYFTISA